MKYIFLSLFFCVAWGSNYAQVGINLRQNALGIFHIDGKGDNSATPTSAELANDMIIEMDANSLVGMSLGKLPQKDAQLVLASKKKALLLNRVALTKADDNTTVASPQRGMIVYNTSNTASLTEGVYFYHGADAEWKRIDNTISRNADITRLNLLNDQVTTPITNAEVISGQYKGVLLKFTSTGKIQVDETASYTFAFRLFGSIPVFPTAPNPIPSNPSLVHYYIYLVRNGVNLDSAELDINAYSKGEQAYTVTLGASLLKNDQVEVYLAHHTAHAFAIWTLKGASATALNPTRTSLIYWKLL